MMYFLLTSLFFVSSIISLFSSACYLNFHRSFFYYFDSSLTFSLSWSLTASVTLELPFLSQTNEHFTQSEFFLFSWLGHFFVLGCLSMVKQLKGVQEKSNYMYYCFSLKGISKCVKVSDKSLGLSPRDCGKERQSLIDIPLLLMRTGNLSPQSETWITEVTHQRSVMCPSHWRGFGGGICSGRELLDLSWWACLSHLVNWWNAAAECQ